jgi:glutathione S-transferase
MPFPGLLTPARPSSAPSEPMTTVLRILKHTDIVTRDQRLAAYIERSTARPAFKRELDAQIGDFQAAA